MGRGTGLAPVTRGGMLFNGGRRATINPIRSEALREALDTLDLMAFDRALDMFFEEGGLRLMLIALQGERSTRQLGLNAPYVVMGKILKHDQRLLRVNDGFLKSLNTLTWVKINPNRVRDGISKALKQRPEDLLCADKVFLAPQTCFDNCFAAAREATQEFLITQLKRHRRQMMELHEIESLRPLGRDEYLAILKLVADADRTNVRASLDVVREYLTYRS
jgi:hypothetical protein